MAKELPFDFTMIETPRASLDRCTDERLLKRIMGLDLVPVGGYGLIAELAKRYMNEKKLTRSDIVDGGNEGY